MVNLIGSWFPDRNPASRDRRALRHPAPSRPGRRQARRSSPSSVPTTEPRASPCLMEIAHHLNDLQHALGCRPGPVRRRRARLRQQPTRGRVLPRLGGVCAGLRRSGRSPTYQNALRGRIRPRHGRRSQPADQAGAEQPEPCSDPGSRSLERRADSSMPGRSSRRKVARSSTITWRSTTPASRPSTSSTSTTHSGTRPTTCRRTARPKAWPRSVVSSPPG